MRINASGELIVKVVDAVRGPRSVPSNARIRIGRSEPSTSVMTDPTNTSNLHATRRAHTPARATAAVTADASIESCHERRDAASPFRVMRRRQRPAAFRATGSRTSSARWREEPTNSRPTNRFGTARTRVELRPLRFGSIQDTTLLLQPAMSRTAIVVVPTAQGVRRRGLTTPGPLNLLALRWQPAGHDRRMVTELWQNPDGFGILELTGEQRIKTALECFTSIGPRD